MADDENQLTDISEDEMLGNPVQSKWQHVFQQLSDCQSVSDGLAQENHHLKMTVQGLSATLHQHNSEIEALHQLMQPAQRPYMSLLAQCQFKYDEDMAEFAKLQAKYNDLIEQHKQVKYISDSLHQLMQPSVQQPCMELLDVGQRQVCKLCDKAKYPDEPGLSLIHI